MNLGTAQVIRADARNLPLADNSVDLIVTSPPYFALRSYQDGGEHYAGQIGSEPTPAEFVDALLDVTRECMRVLKPCGSLWVNLGDKYAGSQPAASRWHTASLDGGRGRLPELAQSQSAVKDSEWGTIRPKSLIGIPWRYALRCIDDLGLILRAEVIWSKPNGLPESVTDRVRRSHEQWFHFVQQPRYFSAVDEIREPHKYPTDTRHLRNIGTDYAATDSGYMNGGPNPLGKLPGSVWSVPTEPLRVPDHLGIDHFAAFPTEWPKRIIQGWSPAGVCVECGDGRRPASVETGEVVSSRVGAVARPGPVSDYGGRPGENAHKVRDTAGTSFRKRERLVTGYACACPEPTIEQEVTEFDYEAGETVTHVVTGPDPAWQPTAPTTPAVVLDPFGGTGTTALVAKALGRHGISVDMSQDYCRLAQWRVNDRDQLAKVLAVAKAEQQPEAQTSLLDLLSEETA